MRIGRRYDGVAEGDLTPMIDMTFQLIAFFMVLINFDQSEQDKRIQLPISQLAIPPEEPFKYPITMHLTKDKTADGQGIVVYSGQEIPSNALKPYLNRQKTAIANQGLQVADATIIIRAHKDTETVEVQKLIKECQDNSFESFVLRAENDRKTN